MAVPEYMRGGHVLAQRLAEPDGIIGANGHTFTIQTCPSVTRLNDRALLAAEKTLPC
jgi:hypothetical protein